MPPIATLARQHWLDGITERNPAWYSGLYASNGGKMFGVLVVDTPQGAAYWVAYSGMLDGQWNHAGFVPPIVDVAAGNRLLHEADTAIQRYNQHVADLQNTDDYQAALTDLDTTTAQAESILAKTRLLNAARKTAREQLRATHNAENRLTANRQSQQDRADWKRLKKHWRDAIAVKQQRVAHFQQRIEAIESERRAYSAQAQHDYFALYNLQSESGSTSTLADLFSPHTPPSGAGDCAAPKLLQAAWLSGYRPLALAEFWLGASPTGEVRHDRQFYPPCRSRCAPILQFMLPADATTSSRDDQANLPAVNTIYEDDDLIAINKPSGLLSVPGKSAAPSAFSLISERYPALRIIAVHRLDQDTSGVMLFAKSLDTYRQLQRQFASRTVTKRYVAVLNGTPAHDHGTIELPLRVDLNDRPRQMVCTTHGKPARTRYRVISSDDQTTRVEFFPETGRTHQLRVHAAHRDGLDAPIRGDTLYGNTEAPPINATRLQLHAEVLTFEHPQTKAVITLSCPTPF